MSSARIRSFPFVALLASASLSAQVSSPALESVDLVEMAPFVVTSENAQSILHITGRDLDQRQAIDLEDALSIDPSITVGGSTGIAQKIYVRNLGEGLLNVSVDGATQSGSLFHHIGRIAIEPELLKQVEVQPGVGTATDGPGALGGAIRFITKDPEDLLRPGERAGASLKAGYFSNTRGYRASATGFGRAPGGWSGLISVVSSDHEEIEDGRGNRLTGSDSRQDTLLGKVVGNFGDGHTVRFGFETLSEDGNKLRRPEWAPSPANPAFYMEGERKTATAGYGFNPSRIDWLDLKLSLSYTDADVLQIATFGPYVGDIESVQLDLRNTHQAGAHLLVYGVDHRRDEVTAGPRSDPRSVGEDSTVTGLFIQDTFRVTDRLDFSAGARFDMYRLDDRLDQEFDHEGFSPNVGVTYALTPRLSLNASIATAYRGPDINDAFRVDIAENEPGLDAEKARNAELRLLYQKERVLLEAGVYRNRIKDVITNTLPWSRIYTNAGELDTDGFFARASYATERTHISLQYNHADTDLNGQTATRYQYSSLVSRMGDTWVLDAFWRPVPEFELGWNARLVQGVDDILVPEVITEVPNSHIEKPGYTTHDFYARWSPGFAPAVVVNLTVKNAFDKYYLSHGSVEDLTAFPGFDGVVGAPEAGRDIRLSLTLRF